VRIVKTTELTYVITLDPVANQTKIEASDKDFNNWKILLADQLAPSTSKAMTIDMDPQTLFDVVSDFIKNELTPLVTIVFQSKPKSKDECLRIIIKTVNSYKKNIIMETPIVLEPNNDVSNDEKNARKIKKIEADMKDTQQQVNERITAVDSATNKNLMDCEKKIIALIEERIALTEKNIALIKEQMTSLCNKNE